MVLCFLLIASSAPGYADAQAQRWLKANKVEAPAYLLMDLQSGRILEEKNMHQRREPASTTKMMTALVAIESGKLDKTFTIGSKPPMTSGSSLFLEKGETFTLRQLVQGMLVRSANDAAVAIAQAVSGSVPKFVHRMNLKAKQLGCRDTHFENPHGLHNPKHYSTAYDLAIIARAALKYPFFDKTVNIKKITLHGNKHMARRIFPNRNRLLLHWPPCDGVKTGYTHQAGRCLVATATEADPLSDRKWRLLSVVLHAPNCWSDSINLLQHRGFDQFHPVQLADAGKVLLQVPVENGAGKAAAMVQKDYWAALRAGAKQHLKEQLKPLELKAPVRKGQIVATVTWRKDGHKIATIGLVAQNDVDKTLLFRTQQQLTKKYFLQQPLWVWIGLFVALLFAIFRVSRGKKKRRKK